EALREELEHLVLARRQGVGGDRRLAPDERQRLVEDDEPARRRDERGRELAGARVPEERAARSEREGALRALLAVDERDDRARRRRLAALLPEHDLGRLG